MPFLLGLYNFLDFTSEINFKNNVAFLVYHRLDLKRSNCLICKNGQKVKKTGIQSSIKKRQSKS